VSEAELCDLVAEVGGRSVVRAERLPEEDDAFDMVPDISLARRRLGFAPRPLREWLVPALRRSEAP
jgi:nucleoside-diphosphate-sugar epimerase